MKLSRRGRVFDALFVVVGIYCISDFAYMRFAYGEWRFQGLMLGVGLLVYCLRAGEGSNGRCDGSEHER